MRKVIASLVCATAVLWGAPVHAETFEGSSISAQAFGVSNEQRASGQYKYRVTFWGIFAYRATDGSFVDVFRDVLLCKKPGAVEPQPEEAPSRRHAERDDTEERSSKRCVFEASQAGFSENLSDTAFTLDTVELSVARLDTVVPMQDFKENGKPTKKNAVPTRVVADWTGTGDTTHAEGTFSYSRGSCHQTDTFKDDFRDATAQAALGSRSLGQSEFASIGKSSFKTTSEGCDDEPGPASAQRHRG